MDNVCCKCRGCDCDEIPEIKLFDVVEKFYIRPKDVKNLNEILCEKKGFDGHQIECKLKSDFENKIEPSPYISLINSFFGGNDAIDIHFNMVFKANCECGCHTCKDCYSECEEKECNCNKSESECECDRDCIRHDRDRVHNCIDLCDNHDGCNCCNYRNNSMHGFYLDKIKKEKHNIAYVSKINSLLKNAVIPGFNEQLTSLYPDDESEVSYSGDDMDDIWYSGKREPTRSELGSDNDVSFSDDEDSVEIKN